ncbi:MAG TPA: AarF/UbiB family protein [Longimicrobiales bacterium]|nr:AarF/UbiB family protein [Longimicrobiales bacterium]
MRRWRRGWTIFHRLLPFVVAFLRDRRRWILFGRPRPLSRSQHERRAERLTATIAALGPTFIKLAQVFSARADILPEPYLSAVSRLQDQVPPDPSAAIEAVLEAELGAAVDVVFAEFERVPVAAASLGQVHAARLGGEKVAVKVLRPGVEALVAVDLDISFRILFLLNVFFPNHHVRALTTVVREFSVRVREEMDFREEAAHMAMFHEHFGAERRVRAPRVYEHLTRRRVLVMEWVDGDKVNRLADRFASGELSFARLMQTLTEVYLRMLLVEGFLHADPHPGNILVEADGTIVFLDWGMVVQFGRSTRDSILRLAMAAAREDIDAMINGMYELGMIDPGISRAEIRDAATEILGIVDRARELGQRRVQEMLYEIMDTFYTWPLILPRELVYFFRAAALLEGIGFLYDPSFNGLDVAKPVIARMRGEILAAVAHEPREIARGIMDEARAGIAAVREIVRRAEREEFRVRIHPRDVVHLERFFLLQVRRILLSLFAVSVGVITAITFVELRNAWVLLAGLAVALLMFLIVLVIPSHLLENPLRHARGLRPPGEAAERAPRRPGPRV